ncbi:MAG: LacI family transcriptional regulator [Lentisphaerae bacterium]|nr:MAG: LacI family transcriptional regulator [Lentisphaerota bacterium]
MARVTIKEIANATGVHPMTVSRALRNDPKVAAKTLERIRSAARRLGYVPNAAARAIVTGKFNTVSLVLSTCYERSILPFSLQQALINHLHQRSCNLMFTPLSDEVIATLTPTRFLSEIKCDGILINYNATIPESLFTLTRRLQLPVIWINSKHPSNCIYPDDFKIGQFATRLLIEHGHRHIVFANHAGESHYSVHDRISGYRNMMHRHHLSPELITRYDATPQQLLTFWQPILRSPQRPTAIFAYTSFEAWIIYRAATIAGLSIPQDLSLVCVHDAPATHIDIELTTVLLPESAIAQQAVDDLLTMVETGEKDSPARAIPPEYEPGRTLGPPSTTSIQNIK